MNDECESYTILSRMIISKLLASIGIEPSEAAAMAKQLKKTIVNDNKFKLSQKELVGYIHNSLQLNEYDHLIPIYEYMDRSAAGHLGFSRLVFRL